MKGNSNSEPNKLEQLGIIFQIKWNIVRNDRPGNHADTIESWDYDYVNCESKNRGAVVRAIMRDKYPLVDDEIAIINNKEANAVEYEKYQQYRELAKQIADEALQ